MAFNRLPNEILRLITLELEIVSLCRLSSTSKRLRIEAEELLYKRAVEQDRVDPMWPVSLTIAAISGSVYGFKRLLEETKWPIHEYSRSNLNDHPYTKKWAKSLNKPFDWELYNTTLLHIVSHLGNEEMVKLVLDKLGREEHGQPYPTHPYMLYDKGSRTPLHRAAEMGKIGALELLLAAGANVRERDSQGGNSALEYAISYGHIDAAAFLVRAGADVLDGCLEEPQITPLVQACMCESLHLVNLLIEFGASEDVGNALGFVASGGNLSIAQFLIDTGTRPLPCHLERAAHYGGMEMLQLLIRNGGKFDYHANKTILHNGDCSPEITQFILNEIPQVANTRDYSGLTPLDTVYRRSPLRHVADTVTSTARCLIQAGGEVTGTDTDYDTGMTTLQMAIRLGHGRMVTTLLELDSQKQLISVRDVDGRSALHHACSADETMRLTVAELLINAGIDVHIEAHNGETPLHLAASDCALELIPLLVRAGVDVSHQDAYGNTALHKVAKKAMTEHKRVQGYASLAGSIILGDMDVTVEVVGGERRLKPLMRSGYTEMMRLLVASGIDITLQNDHRCTALDIIARNRILGAGTPLPGNRGLNDMKGAGQAPETRAAILEWLSPEEDDGLDGTDGLEGFWGGIEGS